MEILFVVVIWCIGLSIVMVVGSWLDRGRKRP